jgi:DNA-directed RNA polymerase subunit RPC12/RpoP
MPTLTEADPTTQDRTHAPQGEACPACGAPHDKLDQFCPACGTALAPAAAPEEQLRAQKHIRCENCGSEISTDPDQRSYTCLFCDSTYVVEFSPDQTGRQPPEFVIGFAVTPEQAHEQFREWLTTNSWFRPGDLKTARVEDKLRGLYLPFWAFSMLAESGWDASIGEYWYRTETYTTTVNGKTVTRTRRVRETEWWPLSGKHHRYYSGFLVSGSRGLPQSEAERIKPFYLQELKRYAPAYLAGWSAEEYSVEREKALDICQQEFYRQEKSNVAAFLPGDTYRDLAVDTQFSRVSSDLILLPIYILSYRYRDKVYRFLLNGQTGRAAGDKPVSAKRITAAVLAAVGLVVLVALFIMLLNS